MNMTTLKQGRKILGMLEGTPAEQAQKLLRGGYFSDLLKANTEQMNRADFQKICGLVRIIDCDADPFVPSGFTLMSHRKGGQIIWDPRKAELYLSKGQKNGKVISGNDLDKELANVSGILNANVLDYLLAHQELIPKEWEGKFVYFWGTEYLSVGTSYVRYLRRGGGRWYSYSYWLGYGWDGDSPAARFAS
ncbi:MAG: hypothetical protein A2981_02600 [Candidatus Nealsonbacteria bacterium RIFCSPLOWO2_01_FULL_38_120]|nr:MAG: hypothetical protein A2981_02600 [Candidatus Nealsonbacteria bacterium RIFCSPLOWO2_01_FULL_38_120]